MPYVLQNAYCGRGIEGTFTTLDEAIAAATRIGFEAFIYQDGLWVATFVSARWVWYRR